MAGFFLPVHARYGAVVFCLVSDECHGAPVVAPVALETNRLDDDNSSVPACLTSIGAHFGRTSADSFVREERFYCGGLPGHEGSRLAIRPWPEMGRFGAGRDWALKPAGARPTAVGGIRSVFPPDSLLTLILVLKFRVSVIWRQKRPNI
ncbi:MAG: hypothetical protein O9327_20690, partial [Polaromonas sp.]|nr:hypothetical protein [Polaromonas sp.]